MYVKLQVYGASKFSSVKSFYLKLTLGSFQDFSSLYRVIILSDNDQLPLPVNLFMVLL